MKYFNSQLGWALSFEGMEQETSGSGNTVPEVAHFFAENDVLLGKRNYLYPFLRNSAIATAKKKSNTGVTYPEKDLPKARQDALSDFVRALTVSDLPLNQKSQVMIALGDMVNGSYAPSSVQKQKQETRIIVQGMRDILMVDGQDPDGQEHSDLREKLSQLQKKDGFGWSDVSGLFHASGDKKRKRRLQEERDVERLGSELTKQQKKIISQTQDGLKNLEVQIPRVDLKVVVPEKKGIEDYVKKLTEQGGENRDSSPENNSLSLFQKAVEILLVSNNPSEQSLALETMTDPSQASNLSVFLINLASQSGSDDKGLSDGLIHAIQQYTKPMLADKIQKQTREPVSYSAKEMAIIQLELAVYMAQRNRAHPSDVQTPSLPFLRSHQKLGYADIFQTIQKESPDSKEMSAILDITRYVYALEARDIFLENGESKGDIFEALSTLETWNDQRSVIIEFAHSYRTIKNLHGKGIHKEGDPSKQQYRGYLYQLINYYIINQEQTSGKDAKQGGLVMPMKEDDRSYIKMYLLHLIQIREEQQLQQKVRALQQNIQQLQTKQFNTTQELMLAQQQAKKMYTDLQMLLQDNNDSFSRLYQYIGAPVMIGTFPYITKDMFNTDDPRELDLYNKYLAISNQVSALDVELAKTDHILAARQAQAFGLSAYRDKNWFSKTYGDHYRRAFETTEGVYADPVIPQALLLHTSTINNGVAAIGDKKESLADISSQMYADADFDLYRNVSVPTLADSAFIMGYFAHDRNKLKTYLQGKGRLPSRQSRIVPMKEGFDQTVYTETEEDESYRKKMLLAVCSMTHKISIPGSGTFLVEDLSDYIQYFQNRETIFRKNLPKDVADKEIARIRSSYLDDKNPNTRAKLIVLPQLAESGPCRLGHVGNPSHIYFATMDAQGTINLLSIPAKDDMSYTAFSKGKYAPAQSALYQRDLIIQNDPSLQKAELVFLESKAVLNPVLSSMELLSQNPGSKELTNMANQHMANAYDYLYSGKPSNLDLLYQSAAHLRMYLKVYKQNKKNGLPGSYEVKMQQLLAIENEINQFIANSANLKHALESRDAQGSYVILKTAVVIAATISMVIASGGLGAGALAFLGTAALSVGGGMMAGRMVDESRYVYMNYIDPSEYIVPSGTKVKMETAYHSDFIRACKGELKRKDFFSSVTEEFALGMFWYTLGSGLVVAGNKGLQQMQTGVRTLASKTTNSVVKSSCQTIDNLITNSLSEVHDIAAMPNMQQFMKQFGHEFAEESAEETIGDIGNKIGGNRGGLLGAVMEALVAIKAGTLYKAGNITVWPIRRNNNVCEMAYRPEYTSELRAYFEGKSDEQGNKLWDMTENGTTLIFSSRDLGVITCVASNEPAEILNIKYNPAMSHYQLLQDNDPVDDVTNNQSLNQYRYQIIAYSDSARGPSVEDWLTALRREGLNAWIDQQRNLIQAKDKLGNDIFLKCVVADRAMDEKKQDTEEQISLQHDFNDWVDDIQGGNVKPFAMGNDSSVYQFNSGGKKYAVKRYNYTYSTSPLTISDINQYYKLQSGFGTWLMNTNARVGEKTVSIVPGPSLEPVTRDQEIYVVLPYIPGSNLEGIDYNTRTKILEQLNTLFGQYLKSIGSSYEYYFPTVGAYLPHIYPANVKIDKDGNYIITDIGSSIPHVLKDASKRTNAGTGNTMPAQDLFSTPVLERDPDIRKDQSINALYRRLFGSGYQAEGTITDMQGYEAMLSTMGISTERMDFILSRPDTFVSGLSQVPIVTSTSKQANFVSTINIKDKDLIKTLLPADSGGSLTVFDGFCGNIGSVGNSMKMRSDLGMKNYIACDIQSLGVDMPSIQGVNGGFLGGDVLTVLKTLPDGCLDVLALNGVDDNITTREYHDAILIEAKRVLRPGGMVYGFFNQFMKETNQGWCDTHLGENTVYISGQDSSSFADIILMPGSNAQEIQTPRSLTWSQALEDKMRWEFDGNDVQSSQYEYGNDFLIKEYNRQLEPRMLHQYYQLLAEFRSRCLDGKNNSSGVAVISDPYGYQKTQNGWCYVLPRVAGDPVDNPSDQINLVREFLKATFPDLNMDTINEMLLDEKSILKDQSGKITITDLFSNIEDAMNILYPNNFMDRMNTDLSDVAKEIWGPESELLGPESYRTYALDASKRRSRLIDDPGHKDKVERIMNIKYKDAKKRLQVAQYLLYGLHKSDGSMYDFGDTLYYEVDDQKCQTLGDVILAVHDLREKPEESQSQLDARKIRHLANAFAMLNNVNSESQLSKEPFIANALILMQWGVCGYMDSIPHESLGSPLVATDGVDVYHYTNAQDNLTVCRYKNISKETVSAYYEFQTHLRKVLRTVANTVQIDLQSAHNVVADGSDVMVLLNDGTTEYVYDQKEKERLTKQIKDLFIGQYPGFDTKLITPIYAKDASGKLHIVSLTTDISAFMAGVRQSTIAQRDAIQPTNHGAMQSWFNQGRPMLVHASYSSPIKKLSQIVNRFSADREVRDVYDVLDRPDTLSSRNTLSASLVDKTHVRTRGEFGLGMSVSGSAVVHASPIDAGSHIDDPDYKMYGSPLSFVTPSQLLAPGFVAENGYNEIVVDTRKPGTKPSCLWVKTYQGNPVVSDYVVGKLRQTADKYDLPLVFMEDAEYGRLNNATETYENNNGLITYTLQGSQIQINTASKTCTVVRFTPEDKEMLDLKQVKELVGHLVSHPDIPQHLSAEEILSWYQDSYIHYNPINGSLGITLPDGWGGKMRYLYKDQQWVTYWNENIHEARPTMIIEQYYLQELVNLVWGADHQYYSYVMKTLQQEPSLPAATVPWNSIESSEGVVEGVAYQDALNALLQLEDFPTLPKPNTDDDDDDAAKKIFRVVESNLNNPTMNNNQNEDDDHPSGSAFQSSDDTTIPGSSTENVQPQQGNPLMQQTPLSATTLSVVYDCIFEDGLERNQNSPIMQRSHIAHKLDYVRKALLPDSGLNNKQRIDLLTVLLARSRYMTCSINMSNYSFSSVLSDWGSISQSLTDVMDNLSTVTDNNTKLTLIRNFFSEIDTSGSNQYDLMLVVFLWNMGVFGDNRIMSMTSYGHAMVVPFFKGKDTIRNIDAWFDPGLNQGNSTSDASPDPNNVDTTPENQSSASIPLKIKRERGDPENATIQELTQEGGPLYEWRERFTSPADIYGILGIDPSLSLEGYHIIIENISGTPYIQIMNNLYTDPIRGESFEGSKFCVGVSLYPPKNKKMDLHFIKSLPGANNQFPPGYDIMIAMIRWAKSKGMLRIDTIAHGPDNGNSGFYALARYGLVEKDTVAVLSSLEERINEITDETERNKASTIASKAFINEIDQGKGFIRGLMKTQEGRDLRLRYGSTFEGYFDLDDTQLLPGLISYKNSRDLYEKKTITLPSTDVTISCGQLSDILLSEVDDLVIGVGNPALTENEYRAIQDSFSYILSLSDGGNGIAKRKEVAKVFLDAYANDLTYNDAMKAKALQVLAPYDQQLQGKGLAIANIASLEDIVIAIHAISDQEGLFLNRKSLLLHRIWGSKYSDCIRILLRMGVCGSDKEGGGNSRYHLFDAIRVPGNNEPIPVKSLHNQGYTDFPDNLDAIAAYERLVNKDSLENGSQLIQVSQKLNAWAIVTGALCRKIGLMGVASRRFTRAEKDILLVQSIIAGNYGWSEYCAFMCLQGRHDDIVFMKQRDLMKRRLDNAQVIINQFDLCLRKYHDDYVEHGFISSRDYNNSPPMNILSSFVNPYNGYIDGFQRNTPKIREYNPIVYNQVPSATLIETQQETSSIIGSMSSNVAPSSGRIHAVDFFKNMARVPREDLSKMNLARASNLTNDATFASVLEASLFMSTYIPDLSVGDIAQKIYAKSNTADPTELTNLASISGYLDAIYQSTSEPAKAVATIRETLLVLLEFPFLANPLCFGKVQTLFPQGLTRDQYVGGGFNSIIMEGNDNQKKVVVKFLRKPEQGLMDHEKTVHEAYQQKLAEIQESNNDYDMFTIPNILSCDNAHMSLEKVPGKTLMRIEFEKKLTTIGYEKSYIDQYRDLSDQRFIHYFLEKARRDYPNDDNQSLFGTYEVEKGVYGVKNQFSEDLCKMRIRDLYGQELTDTYLSLCTRFKIQGYVNFDFYNPANIIIDDTDPTKPRRYLIDFGHAKILD